MDSGKPSGFRLPQPFHHAGAGCLAIQQRGNGPSQKGEDRQGRQYRPDGEVCPDEPEHPLQEPGRQGGQDQRAGQGQSGRGEGVEQPFLDQHGFQLPGGHAHRLEHRELPPPGQNAGHDGVEEVQDPPQRR